MCLIFACILLFFDIKKRRNAKKNIPKKESSSLLFITRSRRRNPKKSKAKMVNFSEWLERYRRDPKCWPCCRCKRNGQHKNQRFNATSLSSDKIKKTSSSSVPSDCDSSTVFCRLSYRSILSISSFIQWRCVWSAKKYVETSHLSPRSSLHILSSGICPNGSSIFVFLWLLAMVPRAYPESQIENQEKKSIDIHHVRRAKSQVLERDSHI